MKSSSNASTAGTWAAEPGVAAEVLRQHRNLVSVYTTPPAPAEEAAGAADDGGSAFTAPPTQAQLAQEPLAALTRADLPAPGGGCGLIVLEQVAAQVCDLEIAVVVGAAAGPGQNVIDGCREGHNVAWLALASSHCSSASVRLGRLPAADGAIAREPPL